MEPIRILQVVTIMNRGGLETMLMNYYRKMDRTKIQFDFIVHREEKGHYDDEILSLGGKIHRFPAIRPGKYKSYFTLLDRFFEINKDYKVVHSHINENSSFVLKAAYKAGIPNRIAHSHLSDLSLDMKFPFRVYARKAMKSYPTAYFACSVKAGEWLFGKKIKKQSHITVLNNAVDVKEFKYNNHTRQKLRAEFNLKDKFVIGHIGRFNKQKNHEFLLDIFAEISKKKADAVLVLVGEGNLRNKIEKKVDQLGLKRKVLFLGVRKDISNLMQVFDLFLFPSLFEGLPVVLVEAQAAGLKCVVSDSITKETDITGKVEFIGLKSSPKEWAQEAINPDNNRVDTSELLREKGYDTTSMADWLSGYYMGKILKVNKA